jgi:hypothetical protein
MFDINRYLMECRSGLLCKPVHCKSGLNMSVQASSGHYCQPRQDQGPWESVEIGFPSLKLVELMKYAESPEKPTDTVYGWVPVQLVNKIVDENGGLA